MQRQHANLILALLIFSIPVTSTLVATGIASPPLQVIFQPETQAQQAIEAAQTAINTAYIDLLYADSTGAAISDLISSLNGAITVLNQAQLAFDATDYSSAITLAGSAQATALSVSEQANIRRSATLAQQQMQIVIIIAVVVITVLITYFALTRLIRYQRKKRQEFLRMEIQLQDDEEDGEGS